MIYADKTRLHNRIRPGGDFWPENRKQPLNMIMTCKDVHTLTIGNGRRQEEDEWLLANIKGDWGRKRLEDSVVYYFMDARDAVLMKMWFG